MAPQKIPLSLTEILIGILAIGICAAVVAPVLQQGSEAANLAQCRSNLYEIGQATYLYAADHDGATPPNLNFGEPASLAGTYVAGRVFGLLLSYSQGGWGPGDYIGRPHHLFCPSNHPALFESYGYQHPDNINQENQIPRMGYFFMYFAPGIYSPSGGQRSNATIYEDPHRPLAFDLGSSLGGLSPTFTQPSHSSVLNVLHVGGHVTTVSTAEADAQGHMNAVYDWMTEESRAGHTNPFAEGDKE